MNFSQAMQYINEKNKLGIVPGLENIKELLRRLGNPQDKCTCLHIGGTNGKGSIFSYVEEILIRSGKKVGRYVSPTLFTYLERFTINKEEMSESEFAKLLQKVADVVEEMVKEGYNSPTAFEIETAIAFIYFEEQKVDFALIECGMGGDLDGTNVISNTFMTVFASISLDHMQFLGDSISEIAMHKSGIIRENSICVSHPQEKEVGNVLKKNCLDKGSCYVEVDESDIVVNSRTKNGTVFHYKGDSYEISMLGEHQISNACTAIEVINALNNNGYFIEKETVKEGLIHTFWIGRLTCIKHKTKHEMYVDGAHNEKAWLMLKESLNKYFTNDKFVYIIGVLKDKEYEKMVDILAPSMQQAVVITPNNIRGLDKEILAKLLNKKGVKTILADNPMKAMEQADLVCDDNGKIIVCGSLSFLSDYLI